jgi:uncharacterized protein YbgA (DUF1722 family)
MERVKIFNPKGPPFRQGRGLFAAVIMKELPFMPCEEESRLSDPKLRENFIERVFAYHRWCGAMGQKRSISKLVEFHTKHKFLVLAHSETHYRRLGRIVAAAKQIPLGEVYREYGALFMQALALPASAKKHANVLDHMLGYFSKQLCADERQEIVALIGPNGAGKTTLFSLISGFQAADEGSVAFEGRDVTGFAPARMARLGLARSFQIVQVFANLTVHEAVTAAALMRHPMADALKKADETLALVGLSERKSSVTPELSLQDR